MKRGLNQVLGAVLVIALAVALWGMFRSEDAFGGKVDGDRWQAVVLTNDRVYVGKLRSAGSEFYELRDAYFLRETSAAPEADAAGEGDTAPASVQRQVVSLTEELHGPEDRMLIRKDEVLLVENLRADSPVAKSIDELEKK